MKRRTLLATIGSSLLAAGCISDSNATDGTPTEGTPTDGTPTPTPGNDTQSEGDSAGTSFEDVDCPSFTAADRTNCTRGQSAAEGDVYLTVSEEVFTPTTGDDSVETMAITLHNGSETGVGFNPYAWKLKRRTDDGWTQVAPEEYVEPWETVGAGGTFTWELAVESQPSPNEDDVLSITEDIDSGTYAFQITSVPEEQPADTTPSDDDDGKIRIECVALFTVSRS